MEPQAIPKSEVTLGPVTTMSAEFQTFLMITTRHVFVMLCTTFFFSFWEERGHFQFSQLGLVQQTGL